MRFVIFGIFTAMWFAMWWWTYTCHIKAACCEPVIIEASVAAQPVEPESSAYEDLRPIVFEWGSPEPQLRGTFDSFRDSISVLVTDNKYLEITGIADPREPVPVGIEDLALARAQMAKKLWAGILDTQRLTITGRVDTARLSGADSLISALHFRVYFKTAKVEELADRILIYFPFNSTNRIEDPEINAYIANLAEYLVDSGDAVEVVGHSDSFGPEDENYLLALWRATAIKDLLVEYGISDSVIRVISRGEKDPIAPNNTPANAAKNRRVEVKLIKKQRE